MTIRCEIIPVTPFMQNCTVIKCEQTGLGAVLDPGGDVPRILETMESMAVKIEKILITHGHMDHCGGTTELSKALGVPVEGPHREDRFWIEKLPEWSAMTGLPAAEPFEPERWLEDGDTVTVGEQVFEVIHCPGHTPGHVVFFHRGEKLAIVGDVLFQGSIGRTDFPLGDHQTLLKSIRGKLWPLGDDVTFLCGHGPTSTFGHERRTNPFVADFNFG